MNDDEVSAAAKELHRRALSSSVRAGRRGRIVDADLVDLDLIDVTAVMELQMVGWWHRSAGAFVVEVVEVDGGPHAHPLVDLVDHWASCPDCGALIPPSEEQP